MSTGYKVDEQDAMYYMTFQIVGWIDLFTRKVYKDIIIDSLRYCQENKGLLIYAFVIMRNHIHIVLQSTKGRLSAEVGELKSYTAKEILKIVQSKGESCREWMANLFEYAAKKHKRNEKYQVWTHENHAEIIYSSKFFEQKVNYIHDNPVRAGIVEYPEQYIYSSAAIYAGKSDILKIEYLDMPVEKIPLMRSIK